MNSLLQAPFDLLACSWPRPATNVDRCWVGDPDWDIPLMPCRPQPRWELLQGNACWMIDWREFFRTGLKPWDIRQSGEMRGFYLVFQIMPTASGKLVFHDDDGSTILRAGAVVQSDRTAHPMVKHEVEVTAGEVLKIAQWQLDGSWGWGASPVRISELEPAAYFLSSLELVEQRLATPDGPPVKIYTQGSCPARAALAVYSLVLRGYVPEQVLLYGDYQWNAETRAFFERVLPFAKIIPSKEVYADIRRVGGGTLESLAARYWFVMKTCVSLLCEPRTFAMIDDDVLILGSVSDAVDALHDHVFVFAPDADYEQLYISLWGSILQRSTLARTRRVNTGLFWMRNPHDPYRIASLLLRGTNNLGPMGLWEQGFFAALFATDSTLQLPTQRYFYPLFDGLPAGIFGYDYASNPCGFASVHFGGLTEKPADSVALLLSPSVLSTAARKAYA